MGVASLVLGLVGLICAIVPCVGWIIGAPLGLLGLIFGAVAIKKGKGKGLGIAGLVLSIIALLISSYWIYVNVVAVNAANELEEALAELEASASHY